jgi:hypothetical protein
MKKIQPLFFLFLLPIFLIAQSDSKYLLSYDFGLTGSENFYYIPGSNSQFENEVPLFNSDTYKVLGWNARIFVERKIFDFAAIKIGAEVARHGFRMAKLDDLRWPDETDGNGNWVANPDYIREYTPKTFSTNILIPVGFRLLVPDKKLSPYFEYLFSTGWEIMTSNTEFSETEITKNIEWKNHGLRIYNNLAIGLNYKLSTNTILFSQLYGQYELAQESTAPVEDYYFAFGASAGLRQSL